MLRIFMKPYQANNFLSHSVTTDDLLTQWEQFIKTQNVTDRVCVLINPDGSRLHVDLTEVVAILQLHKP